MLAAKQKEKQRVRQRTTQQQQPNKRSNYNWTSYSLQSFTQKKVSHISSPIACAGKEYGTAPLMLLIQYMFVHICEVNKFLLG